MTDNSKCQDHHNRNHIIITFLFIGLVTLALVGINTSLNEYQSQVDSINVIDHNCIKLKQWISEHSDYSVAYSGLGKAVALYDGECK